MWSALAELFKLFATLFTTGQGSPDPGKATSLSPQDLRKKAEEEWLDNLEGEFGPQPTLRDKLLDPPGGKN